MVPQDRPQVGDRFCVTVTETTVATSTWKRRQLVNSKSLVCNIFMYVCTIFPLYVFCNIGKVLQLCN